MADIRCLLSEAALISKHEAAIVCEERTVLYHELDAMVSSVAAELTRRGCREGERVGLYLPHDWRYVPLLFGVIRAGAVACPISTRWPRERVLEALRQIGARRVIARARAPGAGDLADFDLLDPDILLDAQASESLSEPRRHFPLSQPATIVFTSGSVGLPKAALHTYGNHYYSARGSNLNIRLRSRDRWLLSLPLYHVGGLGILFRCVMAGAAMAIPEPDEAPEDAMARLEATHVSLVGTQLHRLMKNLPNRATRARLRAILLGGGPIAPALIRQAMAANLPVFMSYGLTEMASQVTTSAPDSSPAERCTSGRLLKHRELKVSPDGEIFVRGEALFAGYTDASGVVRPCVDEEGWFATGDLGELDASGCLTLRGRQDNMFISGGENIHPEEIESAILRLEGVEECCVVSVPDAEFGARPAAFIRGTMISGSALEDTLPKFKIPVAFFPWPQEGRAGMKPDRIALALAARVLLGQGA